VSPSRSVRWRRSPAASLLCCSTSAAAVTSFPVTSSTAYHVTSTTLRTEDVCNWSSADPEVATALRRALKYAVTTSPLFQNSSSTRFRAVLPAAVPEFLPHDDEVHGRGYSAAYFDQQQITSIPAEAFRRLHVSRIVLNFNPIADNLSEDALRGLEMSIRELELGACGLTA